MPRSKFWRVHPGPQPSLGQKEAGGTLMDHAIETVTDREEQLAVSEKMGPWTPSGQILKPDVRSGLQPNTSPWAYQHTPEDAEPTNLPNSKASV